MAAFAIVGACILAAIGAMAGEWFRRRRGWNPRIGAHYRTAALCSIGIVVTQAIVNSLIGHSGIIETTSLPSDLWVALIIGPALHAITWQLLVHAWDQVTA